VVIASVDAAAHEVTVKELTGGKPLIIRITADSQVKRMLDREAMVEMMHGKGAAHSGEGAAPPPPMMTLGEMLERLPIARIEDLKLNDTVYRLEHARREGGSGDRDLHAGECGDAAYR